MPFPTSPGRRGIALHPPEAEVKLKEANSTLDTVNGNLRWICELFPKNLKFVSALRTSVISCTISVLIFSRNAIWSSIATFLGPITKALKEHAEYFRYPFFIT